jgi:hypothetical protein
MPKLIGKYLELNSELVLCDSIGADFIRQVFPSVAAAARPEMLKDCSVVLMAGSASAELQLSHAQRLAHSCLTQHSPSILHATRVEQVQALGQLGELAVVVDLTPHGVSACRAFPRGAQLALQTTLLPMPSGVSDFAVSSAAQSEAAEGAGGLPHILQLRAPSAVRRLSKQRKRGRASDPPQNRTTGISSHSATSVLAAEGAASSQPSSGPPLAIHVNAANVTWVPRRTTSETKAPKPASLSTVVYERLKDGSNVAWVPETSK